MSTLTIGTPIEDSVTSGPPTGWVQVKCEFCSGDMVCQEQNVKGATLCCLNCLNDKLINDT